MKDDLPYFSHENNAVNHPKMKALRAQFGWEGYGRFWALNEAIARSKNVELDLTTKVNRVTLSLDMGMSVTDFEAFLAFLADPDECGLIRYENGIVTTSQTKEDHSKVMAERNRKRLSQKPVISAFPDENQDFQGTSTEDSRNGAEPPRRNGENGAEESHRVEERRGISPQGANTIFDPRAEFKPTVGAREAPPSGSVERQKSARQVQASSPVPPAPQFDAEVATVKAELAATSAKDFILGAVAEKQAKASPAPPGDFDPRANDFDPVVVAG